MTTIGKNASVRSGPPCPGAVISATEMIPCGRPAVFVVENRTKYKCAYGHRWVRPDLDAVQDPATEVVE